MKAFKIEVLIGEFLGTLILVLLGCGSIGYAITTNSIDLLQIALIWSLGVFLGIVVASRWSYAHLNPAVSFAFALRKRISWKRFIGESFAQMMAAMVAAILLFFIFDDALNKLEMLNVWQRSMDSGWNTAKMFGEFYNPKTVPVWEGMLAEGMGTAVLVYMVLLYSKAGGYSRFLTYSFIGLTVGIIIMFVAPITQCGINPARDLGPRIVSYVAGWKTVFDLPDMGAILCYVLAPFLGALSATIMFSLMERWRMV